MYVPSSSYHCIVYPIILQKLFFFYIKGISKLVLWISHHSILYTQHHNSVLHMILYGSEILLCFVTSPYMKENTLWRQRHTSVERALIYLQYHSIWCISASHIISLFHSVYVMSPRTVHLSVL